MDSQALYHKVILPLQHINAVTQPLCRVALINQYVVSVRQFGAYRVRSLLVVQAATGSVGYRDMRYIVFSLVLGGFDDISPLETLVKVPVGRFQKCANPPLSPREFPESAHLLISLVLAALGWVFTAGLGGPFHFQPVNACSG